MSEVIKSFDELSKFVTEFESKGNKDYGESIYTHRDPFKWTIKRGGLYIADVDGIDCEQSGRKMVLVVSNDVGNRNSSNIIVVFLTSQEKANLPTHVDNVELDKTSTIMCEMIRTISKRRLRKFIGILDYDYMPQVNEALAVSLGLEIV